MGALLVVVAAELVEAGLQLGEVTGQAVAAVLAAQPPLEGLLEPFDLAGGLGVIGAAGERADPGVTQPGFEQHLEAAQLAGEAQPVVRQHPGGQPPTLGGCTERGPRLLTGRFGHGPGAAGDTGVVIEDVEDLDQPGAAAITQSVESICHHSFGADASNRRHDDFGRFCGCGDDEPAAHQDPMHRRHRRHRP